MISRAFKIVSSFTENIFLPLLKLQSKKKLNNCKWLQLEPSKRVVEVWEEAFHNMVAKHK